MKKTLTPFLKTSAPDQFRSHSVPPRGSILITSAPRSARNWTPEGPSRNCVKETTRVPDRIASGGRASTSVDELEDVGGGRHHAATVRRHRHARERLAGRLVALDDLVGDGDRVAEEQRRRKTHAVVAVRDPRALETLVELLGCLMHLANL